MSACMLLVPSELCYLPLGLSVDSSRERTSSLGEGNVVMPSIVAMGSVGIDTIETASHKESDVLGGAASHFSVAASFYTDVGMVGIVGRDFPLEHRLLLEERKIDLTGLEVSDGKTFRWHGKYRDDLDHRDTLDIQLNVYEGYSPRLPEAYRSPRILFLANIGPDTQAAALEQVESADLVAMDTMDLWIDIQRDNLTALLKKVDLLFINEDEARHYTGLDHLVDAGKLLRSWGPERVVLKMGSRGALLFGEDELFCAPAYPHVSLVEPTGAGDSFAGGFLGYLAREGWDDPGAFRRAVIHGSIMGSANVEGFSCKALQEMNAQEIERRYTVFREFTQF